MNIHRRMGIKLITMHGKSICDGVSNGPKRALENAGKEGQLIDSGERAAALYLALTMPRPSRSKEHGGGYWQADRILYGYYDTSLFAVSAVPDALPFAGSSKVHMSAGMCDDVDVAQRDGPLKVRDVFCPCEPCLCLDFRKCKMTATFGAVKTVYVKRSDDTGLPSETANLEEFAALLGMDKVVALRVEPDEADIDGGVWLALMNGKSFTLTQAELHAGQQFEAGWKVVRGHWFSLKSTEAPSGARIYTVLAEETLFNVQSMMRLTDVKFMHAVPRRTRTSTSDWFKNNTFKLPDDVYQKLLLNRANMMMSCMTTQDASELS